MAERLKGRDVHRADLAEAMAELREETELDGRRITARAGHQQRLADRFAVPFAEAVDGMREQLGGGMRAAVPLGIDGGVREPEVRRKIDDAHARARAARQRMPERLDDRPHGFRARGMGQRAEDDVGPQRLPVHVLDGLKRRQPPPGEMGEDRLHRRAGVALGGQRHQFHVRARGQQAHEIGPGVARGAQHRDPPCPVIRHCAHPVPTTASAPFSRRGPA